MRGAGPSSLQLDVGPFLADLQSVTWGGTVREPDLRACSLAQQLIAIICLCVCVTQGESLLQELEAEEDGRSGFLMSFGKGDHGKVSERQLQRGAGLTGSVRIID